MLVLYSVQIGLQYTACQHDKQLLQHLCTDTDAPAAGSSSSSSSRSLLPAAIPHVLGTDHACRADRQAPHVHQDAGLATMQQQTMLQYILKWGTKVSVIRGVDLLAS